MSSTHTTYLLTSPEALQEDPGSFSDKDVEFVGLWSRGFEHSNLASAWVDFSLSHHAHAILTPFNVYEMSMHRVYGTWRHSKTGRGYGHLGGSASLLEVHTMEPPVLYDMGDKNALFGELRHIFQMSLRAPPTSDSHIDKLLWSIHEDSPPYVWRTLCALLDGVLDEEFLAHEIVPYCNEILSQKWPDRWRVMPRHWMWEILQGRGSAKHGLIRVVSHDFFLEKEDKHNIRYEGNGAPTRVVPGADDLWRWVYVLHASYDPVGQMRHLLAMNSSMSLAQRYLAQQFPHLLEREGSMFRWEERHVLEDAMGRIQGMEREERRAHIMQTLRLTQERFARFCHVDRKPLGWVLGL